MWFFLVSDALHSQDYYVHMDLCVITPECGLIRGCITHFPFYHDNSFGVCGLMTLFSSCRPVTMVLRLKQVIGMTGKSNMWMFFTI